ncbi:MAG: hypothetical protein OHK005_15370 [Candidatus Methylacidiphilales bacterium]
MANFLDQVKLAAFPGDFRPPRADLGAWILEAPQEVDAWHRRILEMGARAIRTATWGANRKGLAEVGYGSRVNEANWTAARIALETVGDSGVPVFGWVGPSGAAPEESAEDYREQLGALLDGGCRLILFEGFSDISDMETAVETLRELHHCPAVVLVPGRAGADVWEPWRQRAEGAGADVVGWWLPGPDPEDVQAPVVASASGLPGVSRTGLWFAGSGVNTEAYRAWVGQFGQEMKA